MNIEQNLIVGVFFEHRRMVKKAVQRGRSERGTEAYSFRYVEVPSDASEKKTGTFTIAARSRLRLPKKCVNILERQAVLDGDHYRSSLLNVAKR